MLNYHAPDQEKIVKKAWQISGGNKDFLLTLRGENGTFNPHRQSDVKNKNGVRERSYGICQIHKPSHSDIINDSRFFTDIDWQIEQCWKMFKQSPYQFNAYRVRHKQEQYFNFPTS